MKNKCNNKSYLVVFGYFVSFGLKLGGLDKGFFFRILDILFVRCKRVFVFCL